MNKKHIFAGSLAAALLIGGLAALPAEAANASSNGRWKAMRNDQAGFGYQMNLDARAAALAKALNISQTEAETLALSKPMSEIAKEKNIDFGALRDSMHGYMEEARVERWKKAGMTDEDIAKKKAAMEERQAKNMANCDSGSKFGQNRGR